MSITNTIANVANVLLRGESPAPVAPSTGSLGRLSVEMTVETPSSRVVADDIADNYMQKGLMDRKSTRRRRRFKSNSLSSDDESIYVDDEGGSIDEVNREEKMANDSKQQRRLNVHLARSAEINANLPDMRGRRNSI